MKHRLRINLLATWGEHAIGIAIGLFLMPYVLGILGDERYGLWLFIVSLAGYSGLMNLGFGDTISRFVAHHLARHDLAGVNRTVSVVAVIYGGISLLLATVAGILAWFAPRLYDWGMVSPDEIQQVILILGLNIVIGLLGSVFGGVLVGLQRFDLERSIRTVSGLVRVGLTVALLTTEHSLLTLALTFLAATVVENLGYIVSVYRELPELRIRPSLVDRATLKESSQFSVFAMLNNISAKLIDATDTIVIGIVFGAESIVPYFVAHRLMTFIVEPLQIVGRIVMPRGAELGASPNDRSLRRLVDRGLGLALLLTGGFFVGSWFFGTQVLEAWLGQSYPESHNLLIVLLGAQLIATPLRVLRGVLFGLGSIRLPSLLYAVEAVANLGLTLLLIKPLGLMGVALGTAIPIVAIELFVLLPYALQRVGLSWQEFCTGVLRPQLAPLGALLGYSLVVSTYWQIPAQWLPVISVAAGGGVVLGGVWLAVHLSHQPRVNPRVSLTT